MNIRIEEDKSGRIHSIQSKALPSHLRLLASQGISATAWYKGHRVGSVQANEQGKLLWWCNGDASVELPTGEDFSGAHHVCNLAATGDIELGIGEIQALQRVMTAHAYGLDLRSQVVETARSLIAEYIDVVPLCMIDCIPVHGQKPVSVIETATGNVLAMLECVGVGKRAFYLHCWDLRLLAKPCLSSRSYQDVATALAAVRSRLQQDI